jgi:hypothetical protein
MVGKAWGGRALHEIAHRPGSARTTSYPRDLTIGGHATHWHSADNGIDAPGEGRFRARLGHRPLEWVF